MKRVKLKSRKPNPLFEMWLKEWQDEAASKNSNLQYNFSRALQSLKKYPLPLKSGKDCLILQHFGIKLCTMLDKKLEEHKAVNGDSTIDEICAYCDHNDECTVKRKCNSQQVKGDTNRRDQRVTFKQVSVYKAIDKNHVEDAFSSTGLAEYDQLNLSSWDVGNYVILLTLYKKTQDSNYSGCTTEADLSIAVRELDHYITKGSILKLFDNGLISIVNAPLRYSLTECGVNIAKKICESTSNIVKLINSEDYKQILSCIKSLWVQKSEAATSSVNVRHRSTDRKESKEYHGSVQSSSSKSSEIQRSQSEIVVSERFEQIEEYSVKEKDKEINIRVEKLQEKSKRTRNVNKCTESEAGSSKTVSTDSLQRDICLKPHKYDVILLVDTQETCGGKTKPQHDATLVELSQLGVSFEVRHLNVGDFAWVARCRVTNDELVLPYIVERKRIDDLSASITDGRYYEQKFRLKQSGIGNLMYVVEEYEKNKRLAIPYPSLMQASINTLIQDGFLVKYTRNHKDTMFYISSVTKILKGLFKEKILIGCKKETLGETDTSNDVIKLMEFQEFNKASSKQKVFKVREMFMRHLLQLKGLSVDKALVIAERYPTPRLLIDAMQSSDGKSELLLSSIVFGERRRQIGPVLSKTVHQLYTKKNLN